MSVTIKRAYEAASEADGCRVLVDRLWPRGVSKATAHLDSWPKDVAPSPDLRTWWKHDPDRLDDFTARYRAELDGSPQTVAAVADLRDLIRDNTARGITTTLVYGAKDPHVNHARILAAYLAE
ncbi:DUF488 family protein [Cryobacterium melibiosiphilum]|uniref:DUF488 family protein n=1 Tax=Cryobacterium melibiosiphilum TaxID=995039 RepID=A0A3A5MVX5_9MICO|nr:DUF488 family protein [Cryobacterium melibiosiphilum]RJT89344.1 DUF488 family protein [Cryobacterium melibiosiphilum]